MNHSEPSLTIIGLWPVLISCQTATPVLPGVTSHGFLNEKMASSSVSCPRRSFNRSTWRKPKRRRPRDHGTQGKHTWWSLTRNLVMWMSDLQRMSRNCVIHPSKMAGSSPQDVDVGVQTDPSSTGIKSARQKKKSVFFNTDTRKSDTLNGCLAVPLLLTKVLKRAILDEFIDRHWFIWVFLKIVDQTIL